MNINIPHLYLSIRAKFIHRKSKVGERLYPCVVHAVTSKAGKALTFHVYTDFNAHFSMAPLHALCSKEIKDELPLDFLQLWDCFGNEARWICYDYLYGKRCEVVLKDKKKVWGTYEGTIYWEGDSYSDEPTQYKEGHLILLDNGQLAIQPNNRLFFRDMSFGTGTFPKEPLTVFTDFHSVESSSDRWVTGNSSDFYYDVINQTPKKKGKNFK